jgi:hypothetical protein
VVTPSLHTSIVLLLLAAPSLAVAKTRPAPTAAAATITSESSRRHVDLLASDALQGRNTPSAGLDTAAAYIARELARSGVEPLGGAWYHEFDLAREDLDTGNALSIDGRAFDLKTDFVPFDVTASGAAAGPVVFVGYGISLPDSGFDEYAGLDVRGKVVLAVAGEPERFATDRYALRASPFATTRQKMLNAARHGAVAIMIMPNPNASRLMRASGYPWPSLFPSLPRESARLKLVDDADTTPAIPAVSVGGTVVRGFLSGSFDRVLRLLDAIDSTGRPQRLAVTGTARIATRVARTLVPARNVVGVIRGRERPDEYVVLGAHYDHVGTRPAAPVGVVTAQDTIFNGADDNASGTAALLMAARAFTSLAPDERPARSILFVAFSAEELGLYGSRAFVARPPAPTASMVAMLNMDMVGRNSIDSLSVGGMSRSSDLAALLAEANAADPFVIVDNIEKDFYRSDQAPFARAGVPVLFFHSGDHPDYHRETDNPDRIDNAKVAKVARLVFRMAWLVAETPSRPTAVPVDPDDPEAAGIFDR